jgi:hypothetical protein
VAVAGLVVVVLALGVMVVVRLAPVVAQVTLEQLTQVGVAVVLG